MTPPTARQFSFPVVRRLPEYHAFLEAAAKRGELTTSSTAIAEHLNIDPVTVRKDLESIGATGRPKIGFSVPDLMTLISNYMGWGKLDELVIVGCGNQGSALMGYDGFAKRGFKIVAGFDQNVKTDFATIHGISVLPMHKMVDLITRLHIELAIITVPPEAAQQVADQLVAAGIKGIWNFSPAALKVPKGVVLQQEDLISSLVILQKGIQRANESARVQGGSK
jgi:redox-sensing transcriptional repressor